MRVLFTTAWYPNRKVAGDGVFIQKHAQAVARLDDVAVLMVQTDEAKRDYSIEIEARDASADLVVGSQGSLREVLVYVRKTWVEIPLLTGLIRLFWLMAGYVKGYRYIQKHYWQGQRPEVSHVNVLTRAAGLPWLLRKIFGIPYIITEHWSRYARPESFPESGLQLRFCRWFVRDASYVCPVSLNLEQAMKRWQLDNKYYTRVSNVVDTDVFTLPATAPVKHGQTRFVHVSWMRDDAKNISGILSALAQLRQQRSDFHLRLVGEGNDKPMLQAMAEQLGLTPDYVTFVEAKSGQTLAEELQQNDCLLMFSNFENQPVSVLEALACGLPVIATSVGSIPSMLAGNRGFCVQPGDQAGLVSALDSFISLHQSMTSQQLADLTMARQRRQYVVSHHSPEVIARQFDALYHSSQLRIQSSGAASPASPTSTPRPDAR